jgi:hypothetical protein
MNEITIFYWIGYFSATGVILCIGLYAWVLFLNTISDIINRTLREFRNIFLVIAAMGYLRRGEIKDRNNNGWKITVSEDKKKLTLEEVDVSEW